MTTNTHTDAKKPFSNRTLSMSILIGFALVIGGLLIHQPSSMAEDIVVYKSPTCGCCGKWVDHLKDKGFDVKVYNRSDMGAIKAELGVPPRLQSCHTAKVGGYVVEGHVPADDIARLLKEKPQIKGLTAPGMPMGSPGMEGPRKEAYDVLSFRDDGQTAVYAHH